MIPTSLSRRYSLRVEGELLDPRDFNEIDAYNPSRLKADASLVARYVARTLDVEVTLVKHLVDGDRDEAIYTPRWNA